MPTRFTQRIVEHLAHDTYRPAEAGDIAREMRVDPEDRTAFDQAVDLLIDEGRLTRANDMRLRLPSLGDAAGDEITGSFRLNPRGFGFIIPDARFREGDVFVPQGSTGGAMSRDRVRARIMRRGGRGAGGKWGDSGGRGGSGGSGGSGGRGGPGAEKSDFTARIVEILDRGQENFTGTLIRRGNQWLVEPDGRSLHAPLVIRDPHAKTPGKAKEGDKVVFEITQYPDGNYVGEGVITKVLGEAGRPDVETQAVIAAHNLRVEFPEDVVQQARDASKQFEREKDGPWEDREDLTGEEHFIFTIDPPDAKDFDDAISIEHDDASGEWTLGVHIADVSYFVRQGEAMDEEARARGNSAYLPRLVIPMLPEVLSNGVCSLQEGVNRFTKSAFMTFDSRGKVLRQRVSNTVIRSRRRLTYIEAQALIDGHPQEARKHARTEPNYSDELIETLRRSDRLARILEQRRQRDGMIVLNLPEVELVFDDEGHVIDAEPEDNAYTHKLIEMFMVEANEALARLFEDLNVPILRRVHPEPSFGDMQELRLFAIAGGVRVPDEPTRKDLQAILDATRNTPAARAIHFAVLRTLTKAEYSPALIGHFALASEAYAHFTSPIRRYPDLTLHRALDAYLDLTDNGTSAPGGKKRHSVGRLLLDDPRVLDEGTLINLGKHTSSTEVEAEQAERELREFLVLQFLHDKHLGDEFQGVITGMTAAGIFISIDRFLVEGRIAVRDLPSGSAGDRDAKPDRWMVDESVGRARAGRSGAVIAIGDIVTIQVVAVDLPSRKLDLAITKMPEKATQRPASEQREKGSRFDHHADTHGTRRGRAMNQTRKDKKHRKGFKQGRRGRKSR